MYSFFEVGKQMAELLLRVLNDYNDWFEFWDIEDDEGK